MNRLKAIRKVSKPLHVNIENLLFKEALSNQKLTKTQFQRLLLIHYCSNAEIETFTTGCAALNKYMTHSSTALLKDLQSFDIALETIKPMLRETAYDDSFTIGLHYVSFGSLLGSSVLSKSLAKYTWFRPNEQHFFKVRPNLPSLWKDFIHLLNTSKDLNDDSLKSGVIKGFEIYAYYYHQTAHYASLLKVDNTC